MVTRSIAFVCIFALAAPVGLAADAETSDKFAQVRGFKVDITNAGGKEHDTAWESVSGGEMVIETTETTVGSDKFQKPGFRFIDDTVLKMTGMDGKAGPASVEIGPCGELDRHICLTIRAPHLPPTFRNWSNQAVKEGRPVRRDVTVTVVRPDQVRAEIVLFDAFPAEWSLVDFGASSSVQTETLRVKIGRIEFKS